VIRLNKEKDKSMMILKKILKEMRILIFWICLILAGNNTSSCSSKKEESLSLKEIQRKVSRIRATMHFKFKKTKIISSKMKSASRRTIQMEIMLCSRKKKKSYNEKCKYLVDHLFRILIMSCHNNRIPTIFKICFGMIFLKFNLSCSR